MHFSTVKCILPLAVISGAWERNGQVILRDGNGKETESGNEGRERREEGKGRDEPALPIKIVPAPLGNVQYCSSLFNVSWYNVDRVNEGLA